MPDNANALLGLLQPARGRAFAVLDAAVNDVLVDRLYETPELAFDCLSEGDVEPDEFYVSPFLTDLTGQGELQQWLVDGWGKAWGIYLIADMELDAMYRHLRQYLRVRVPGEQFARFRFFDPRVFRVAMPILAPQQQSELLGPMQEVICEGLQSTQALRFALGPTGLVCSSTRLG